MMYTVFAVALSAALIVLTVTPLRKPEKRKRIALLDGILATLGGILLIAVGILARLSLSDESLDAEWVVWAWGRLVVYYKLSLLAVGGILGFLLLSLFVGRLDPKHETPTRPLMRISVSLASSILFLLVTPFYAYMLQNTALPMVEYVLFSGIGEALLFRLIPALSHNSVKTT